MPTYDYRCARCGELKEEKHSVEEHPLFFHCGVPMRKKYHGTAIVFKGGGWACKS